MLRCGGSENIGIFLQPGKNIVKKDAGKMSIGISNIAIKNLLDKLYNNMYHNGKHYKCDDQNKYIV